MSAKERRENMAKTLVTKRLSDKLRYMAALEARDFFENSGVGSDYIDASFEVKQLHAAICS